MEVSEDDNGEETVERVFMTSHEDIKDKGQTVTFEVRTGDENNTTMYWYILGGSLIVLAGLVIALIMVRKKKSKK